MITIHKYARPINQLRGVIQVDMPLGAKILSVGNQNENLCIWAQVDDQQPNTKTTLLCAVATGKEVPETSRFLGTVLFEGGALVYHIYARERK